MKGSWVADWIQWPVLRAQSAAERNAQQAMIALAVRRREREDVEYFLAHLAESRTPPSDGGQSLPSAVARDPRQN